MHNLPPELLRQILVSLPKPDLLSLSRVNKTFNFEATTLLYNGTEITIEQRFPSPDDDNQDSPIWLNQIKSLVRNERRQCDAIKEITIVGSGVFWTYSKTEEWMKVASYDERLPEVLALLSQALENMSRLREFVWGCEFNPSNSMLRAVSKHNISRFVHCSHNMSILEWFELPDPDFTILSTCPIKQFHIHPVTESCVQSTAFLLSSWHKTLTNLELDFCFWNHYHAAVEKRSFEQPKSMKEARIHSADELLPLWKYLLEKGEKLNLTDLELKKQTMFQIDNVCKVINFQVLKRLVLRETRMYVEQDGENIWKFLTNVEGIRLKTLYTDAEYESLNGFLKSFKGLEELFLCDVDKRWLPSTDEFFSTITLSQGRTLKRFFYGRDVHGSNYLDANLIRKFIFGCPNLEELGFAMREEDMEATLTVLELSLKLNSIYIVDVQKSSSLSSLHAVDFIDYLFTHYRRNTNSSFFPRLKKFSYRRFIWIMLPEGKPLSAKIESQVPEGLEPAHGKTAAWVNWNYFEEDDAVDAVRLYVMNEVWGDDDYVESEEEEEEEEEDEDDDEEGEGEDKADEAQVDDVGSSLR